MLEQTKNAIEKMKKAGFTRREYSARCYKTQGEWGKAIITVWNSSLITERLDAILGAGLGISETEINGKSYFLIATDYSMEGKHSFRNLTELSAEIAEACK